MYSIFGSSNIKADYFDYIYKDRKPTYNSLGQVGLINTPTAEIRSEGTVSFTFNKNDMWKIGTLTVSPFNWMEASYFYYRPSDLTWEVDLKPGHFLDKGFNVKFLYESKYKFLPNIAIGLDDFAGTGYFSKEYIVATQKFESFKLSYGLGWGKFKGEKNYKNPFSFVSNRFEERPILSENIGQGGAFSYDKWFRGNISYFAGVEWYVPKANGLKFKLEYDPLNYFDFTANFRSDVNRSIREKDSNLNYGLSYPISDYIDLDFSYIKGNTINMNINFAINFNKNIYSKPKFKPSIKKQNTGNSKLLFYEDLLFNLNQNKLFLQTAHLKDGQLDVAISSSDHRNPIRSSSYAAHISKEVSRLYDIDINKISISHINAGVELNKIVYFDKHLSKNSHTPIELKKEMTKYDSGNKESYLDNEFKPNVNFPVFFTSTAPTISSHIGNPQKFYYGGINIQNISEIQFSRNLLLSSEINYSIYNNFQNTLTGPASEMEHVRTDLVEYLKEPSLSIGRMQLDYIWSPYKDVYSKVSAGIFEKMFGGIGGEILYKPFNKNYSLGINMFYVKQRDYSQKFSFRDYETTTGHVSFGLNLPLNIEALVSYGRYLAKDDGYTVELARKTKSGFKAGIYFSQTNVSPELFGEGSFDKGFYFTFPMDIFSKNYVGNYSSFKLSPLTRDGGAMLEYDKDLRGLIYNANYRDFVNSWGGFLD